MRYRVTWNVEVDADDEGGAERRAPVPPRERGRGPEQGGRPGGGVLAPEIPKVRRRRDGRDLGRAGRAGRPTRWRGPGLSAMSSYATWIGGPVGPCVVDVPCCHHCCPYEGA